MKKYTATLQIDVLVDVQVRADSLEQALAAARKIPPSEAIKAATKKNAIVNWEAKSVTSVYEE